MSPLTEILLPSPTYPTSGLDIATAPFWKSCKPRSIRHDHCVLTFASRRSLIQTHGKMKPNATSEAISAQPRKTPVMSAHRPTMSMTHAELGAAAMSSSPQFPKMPVPASEAIMGISALDEKLRRGHGQSAPQASGSKAS